MLRHTKRALVLIVATFFILLGVVGLVLPFLQGLLFLAVGLLLLSVLLPGVRERVTKHTAKYPTFHRAVLRLDRFLRGVIGEV